MRAFGQRAQWIVSALILAGVSLAVLLTGGVVRLDDAYQQRLLTKLALVAGLLSFAAWNRLRLTPQLTTDYAAGVAMLRNSIRCEIALALAILGASAWLVATAPAPEPL
jgi:putative copper export protein